MIPALLSGIGLSASTGLNAYLPLLVLALADIASGRINLESPYSFVSSIWGLLILLVLLPIELVADKIPKLDALNDRIHKYIRPLAGAIAMLAIWSDGEEFNPFLGIVLASLVSGFVHAIKARVRPHVSSASRGIANPFVSMAEDAVVVIVAVISLFLPWGVLIVLPLFGFGLWKLYRKMMSGAFKPGVKVRPAV